MKILTNFTGKFLRFENDESEIYIPTAMITNKALLNIDLEKSNQNALSKLKDRLKKDYYLNDIIDKYFPVEKINYSRCDVFRKTTNYIIEREIEDDLIEKIELKIKIKLSANDVLKINILHKDLEFSGTFLLQKDINNKIILNRIFDHDSSGIKYLENVISVSTVVSTINVLRYYKLMDETGIETIHTYSKIIYWIKGVIDVLRKVL